MPGSRSPSSFEIEISTGNMVTDCCTTACGSTFSTTPWNDRWGNASTETVATWPGRTLPMSVSLTSARRRMRLRSAMRSSAVPPLTDEVAEAMTCPAETSCSRTVPEMGARTVASARRCRAESRSVRALTSCASALA